MVFLGCHLARALWGSSLGGALFHKIPGLYTSFSRSGFLCRREEKPSSKGSRPAEWQLTQFLPAISGPWMGADVTFPISRSLYLLVSAWELPDALPQPERQLLISQALASSLIDRV